LFVRGEVLAVRNIELTVGKHEPRGVIDVDAWVRGTRVRVVTTHLGRRPAERLLQVRRLIDGLGPPGSGLMVVMGDFNEWIPLARSLRRMRERFGHSLAPRTFSARTPVLSLDRIWVVPASALLEVRAHRGALARVASDHLPVVARVVGAPDA
jgi:endonuclease/exonuclease/phosphatase family metal-dependent hydrolase